MRRAPPIDVVVAVHDGNEALRTCLAALREHGGYQRLIVVDDASADARIADALCDAAPNTIVLRNDVAHGYVAAINRGIAASRNAVAIVPCDAIVTAGWLERMAACDADIVTPLTPRSVPFTADWEADAVAAAAALASVPLHPDAAAPGPVMLVRREAVTAIGALDASLDEQDALRDFGARARAAGCRCAVCDDAFVATRAGEADRSLTAIAAMLESQLRLATRADIPGILHVVHPRGGGTEKFIRELIASRGDYRHHFLRIHDDRFRLTEAGEAGPVYELARTDAQRHPHWLRDLCAWLRIGLVHVHSMVGSGEDLVGMIRSTALPYCYSVHDMYLPCPTVYLIDADGEYCNATTDPAACRRCLSRFANLATDIERWRERYGEFLEGAARVYAPSQWAGDTLLRYYPDAAVVVAPPHEEPAQASAIEDATRVFALPRDGRRAIGILGAIGPEKGARKVEALAARIRERDLPLRLVVVGYTDTLSRFQSDDAALTVHGAYARDEIEALLDAYAIRVLLFPTVWPETFSYTLSEGWMASRPALVPPRGALGERVAATGAGWLIEGWPDVDTMLDQLVRLTSQQSDGDVERKAALARAVFRAPDRAIVRPLDLYGDLVDEPRPLADSRESRWAIYESACRALSAEPTRPKG